MLSDSDSVASSGPKGVMMRSSDNSRSKEFLALQHLLRDTPLAVVTWLGVYALFLAIQHLTVDLSYGLITHFFESGVLLTALLDLSKRPIGRPLLGGFITLAFGIDWLFKSTVSGADTVPALLMALTLVLQGWLGLWFLQHAGLAQELPITRRKVLSFAWFGAFLPALVSSVLMVLVGRLLASDFVVPKSFGGEVLWLFISRFASVVLVAPVILLGLNRFSDHSRFVHPTLEKEFWLIAFGALFCAVIIFSLDNPPGRALATYSYLLIPVMLVAAVRLPLFQSLLILLLVSLACFLADSGTSVEPDQARRSLMALSVFLSINSGIVWLIGALVEERARSFAKENKQRVMYEMLSRVNQTIVKYNLDRESLFAQVCQIILEETEFQKTFVVLIQNPNHQTPEISVYFKSAGERLRLNTNINAECTLLREVLSEGRAVAASSCKTCVSLDHCCLKPVNSGSVAAFPIHQGGEISAMLAVFGGNKDSVDEDLLRLFQEMADDIGFAMDMYGKRQHLKQVAEVFHHSRESIIIADSEGTILNVNPAFTRITGYAHDEIVGKNPRVLNSGRQDKQFYQNLFEELNIHGYWSGQFWNKRKNGEFYLQRGTISAVLNKQDQPEHYIAIMEDASAYLEAEEKIQVLANFDQLTGLPNRTLLADRFKWALGLSQRTGHCWSLMFIDLDDFKQVNDALGHHLGDELLKEVAQRLNRHIRQTDTICRFGGDEFILLVQGGAEEAAELARRLIDEVSQSYELHGSSIQVGASIGISILFQDGENLDELIQAADIAMYQAKSEGRGGFKFFARTMQSKVQKRLAMKQALKKGLANDELCLLYQPKVVCSKDGAFRKVGYEALVRWNNPETGMVPPGDFIPVAEESGQIAEIDRWVLEHAINELKIWLQHHREGVLPIAVNVSASLFSTVGFVDELKGLLASSGVPADLLELEITEHVATHDMERTLTTLDALKQTGVSLAIDDFGTGYSSLSYLRQFPIDHLKIDMSFVRGVHLDPKKQGLVKGIITMAHSLELRTIAEGVEVEEELSFLFENGCDQFQGYLFGRPQPLQTTKS